MVAILCPHCEEEIELEDDASGVFACPLCDGEFEWNLESDEDSRVEGSSLQFDLSSINPMVAGKVFILGISFIVFWLCFSADTLYAATGESSEEEPYEYTFTSDEMTIYNIYGANGMGKYTYWIDYLTNLNKECVEFTGEKCEGIDMMVENMEAWDSAGNTYSLFILCSLIIFIMMMVLKLTIMLYESAIIEIPLGLAVLLNIAGKGAYYVGCLLWFLAIVLYMIRSPGASGALGMAEGDLESIGYVPILWIGLIISILAPLGYAGLSFASQDD